MLESRRPHAACAVLLAIFALAAPCVASERAPDVETVRIPVTEGISLATDLWRSGTDPVPVVLIRTPYGRRGFDFLAEALVERGYAVAIQDVRGRYDSDGAHEPFRHERNDSLATLRWLAARKWCDGRIGMWGSSYSGYAALVVADAELPQFRSIFSISGWRHAVEIVRPGGANHLLLNLPWMLTQQGKTQRSLEAFDVDRLFRHLPPRDALREAGLENPTWESGLTDVLARRSATGEVPRAVFHLTGWHDMVYGGTLAAFGELKARAKAPHKLAIGPWYHNQFLFGSWEVGDRDFGAASALGTEEIIALTARWFDATLKGIDNGILAEPAVSFFLMGQDAWHDADAWPPTGPSIRPRRYHLTSGGKANTVEGDGALTVRRPAGEGSDRFVYDPADPVPTLGGANFFYFPELMGVRDQRAIEGRADVLVYTSPPLPEALQIVGPIELRLTVSTSAPATDFTGKLVIVEPGGYARIVEEGIVRVAPDPARPPGEPFPLTVALGHTAIEVPAGHRLRVEVSSSNFPKYDRNPNTGVDPFLATELRAATQRVFHGPDQESFLVLPVRASALPAPKQRRPLIEVEDGGPEIAAAVGSDAEALLKQGREQLQAGESQEAIATLARAVELAPESSDAHHTLGHAYLARLQEVSMLKKLGLSKKVRGAFQRAVELEPDNVEARESLAQFYFQAPGIAGGSVEKALAQVEAIRGRDAATAHRLMADHHSARKEPELAIREYRALVAIEPGDANAWLRLGRLYQDQERWDEAFAAFESANASGDNLGALYQIGRTGALSGRGLERSRAAFESYIEIAPDASNLPSVAHAHWRLGMVMAQLGDQAAARRHYEAALRLNPDIEEARQALSALKVQSGS